MEYGIKFTAPHELSGKPENAPILLALSGGADSRALFDLLLKYKANGGASFSVAHVNHMIRGADAERDRDFCQRLAEENGVPFYLLEADVPAMAKLHGRGLEEEARIVRYDFFAKVMRENSIPLLATAHNATDNAETVIFNLARGCGLKGLCGIPHTREFEGGRIIRPLIGATKDEILAYCEKNSLEYVTDKTNADVDYSRNRIRNNILPELLNINENAIANISRTTRLVKADEAFIDTLAQEFVSGLSSRNSVPLEGFCELDPAIKARGAAIMLGKFFTATSVHVESLIELADKAIPHSMLNFPNNVTAQIENHCLLISDEPPKADKADFNLQIFEGITNLAELNMAILVGDGEAFEAERNSLQNIYKNSTTTRISFDKIKDGIFIRPKNDGDKIACGGMHKKLKKLFCEKKIPLELRQKLPVFYDSHGILWVPLVALRDGENKSTNKTNFILFYN